MQINEITTTTIIIVISILIMTSRIDTISSMVFAQNDSEDSETDLNNLTLTNSSEVQVGSSGAELPQQHDQGPLSSAPSSSSHNHCHHYNNRHQNNLLKSLQFASITSFFNFEPKTELLTSLLFVYDSEIKNVAQYFLSYKVKFGSGF